MSVEVSYLLDVADSGVVMVDGDSSVLNNLAEWLDTPRGAIYGLPSWGNDLGQFKHEPTGSTATAVSIEMSVIEGVARDLPDLNITSIWCEPDSEHVDLYSITIYTPYGSLISRI